jgi:hypothetical protein
MRCAAGPFASGSRAVELLIPCAITGACGIRWRHARQPPGDGVLPERLVHDVRFAFVHVGPEIRPLVVPPRLDIQHEARCDLLSTWSSRDVDIPTRQASEPIVRKRGGEEQRDR